MKSLSPLFAFASALLAAACGGNQPAPAAPAPEPASEVVADAGAAAEPAPAPEPAPAEPAKPTLKTPENLQAAYAGETNGAARYKAFAEAADKEKFKGVATLFRAMARAEEVHAKNIADTIKAQGGTPVAGTDKPEVKTTAENVKAALAAETADRDTALPGYAAAAQAEENTAADRLFKGVAEAEGGHIKQLQKADKDVTAWKKVDKTFYLCTVCGNVMTAKKESCPVCGTDPSTFEEIK
jgi:rubrerythrin